MVLEEGGEGCRGVPCECTETSKELGRTITMLVVRRVEVEVGKVLY